jgi:solute carrier family 25 (peroxisomal adenine nucleotide transporter), member 17
MSDALINGLAGAGGGIIAQLLTYPLQTVRGSTPRCRPLALDFWVADIWRFPSVQVNARQQTERDPSKPAFKDGAARQLYLVRLLPFPVPVPLPDF